jgi:hypothetical protein
LLLVNIASWCTSHASNIDATTAVSAIFLSGDNANSTSHYTSISKLQSHNQLQKQLLHILSELHCLSLFTAAAVTAAATAVAAVTAGVCLVVVVVSSHSQPSFDTHLTLQD